MGNMELLILRLIHIFTGVFWAGSAMYLAIFVMPAARALGPDGGKFMGQLVRTKNLPMWMNIIGILNILSGLRLIMILYKNSNGEWFSTRYGIGIFIGTVAAIAAFIIGFMVIRFAANKMNSITSAIAAAGVPPTPEQAQQLGMLRAKIGKGTVVVAWHLAAAVIFMSIARYL